MTLITGFLGAGKSTLVAHVLSAAHGRRVAVVVNEFGAGLGLDKLLVQDGAADRCVRGCVCVCVWMRCSLLPCVTAALRARVRSAALVEEFVELPNGCLCCTVKDRHVRLCRCCCCLPRTRGGS